ncbi:unnamed protein product, partial [Polarella glacialis]
MGPRSLPCPSCGQMFLPSGLKFHVKTCAKKCREVIVQCAYCQMEMQQVSLDGHVSVCKAARRAMELAGKGRFSGATGGRNASWAPTTSEALVVFTEVELGDGRRRCQFCGRGFIIGRYHVHTAICSRLRQARPRSVGGIHTQLPQRIYNAAAARTTFAGSFDRHRCRLFIPRAAAESQGMLIRTAGVARKIGSSASAAMAPWRVLGVDRRASSEEARKAFKRLAMEWHPDRRPPEEKALAEAKFRAISEAVEAMTRKVRSRKAPDRRRLALGAPESVRSKHRSWMETVRGVKAGSTG